jgi:IS30 family transposase
LGSKRPYRGGSAACHQHLVGRKSSYQLVTKVNRKTSDQVDAVITKQLKPLASRVTKTIRNNTNELAEHKAINQVLNTTSYFEDLLGGWQCELNDNYNGMVRRHFYKGIYQLLLMPSLKLLKLDRNTAKENEGRLRTHSTSCFMNH